MTDVETVIIDTPDVFRLNMKDWNGELVPVTCRTEKLKLELENPHPRDKNITFDEGPHVYYVLGADCVYTSVTAVVHNMFEPFESQSIAEKMVENEKFQKDRRYADYRSMTKNCTSKQEIIDVIISSWDRKKEEAAELGTKLHGDCESFYNDIEVHNESTEFQYFLHYAETKEKLGWIPYRTEIKIYNSEHRICGMCDIIYKDSEGKYHLRDYKRTRKVSRFSFGKRGRFPLKHLNDCNYVHHCLQLNLYKYILEKDYDLPIETIGTVVLHPSNKDYVEYDLPFMSLEISELLRIHYNNNSETGKIEKRELQVSTDNFPFML